MLNIIKSRLKYTYYRFQWSFISCPILLNGHFWINYWMSFIIDDISNFGFSQFFSRRFWGLAFLWFPAAIIIRCISMRFVFCNKTWESEIIKARKDQLKHLSPTKSAEQKSKWTEMHFPMQNKYGDINSHNCLRVHLLHYRFLTLSWEIRVFKNKIYRCM